MHYNDFPYQKYESTFFTPFLFSKTKQSKITKFGVKKAKFLVKKPKIGVKNWGKNWCNKIGVKKLV